MQTKQFTIWDREGNIISNKLLAIMRRDCLRTFYKFLKRLREYYAVYGCTVDGYFKNMDSRKDASFKHEKVTIRLVCKTNQQAEIVVVPKKRQYGKGWTFESELRYKVNRDMTTWRVALHNEYNGVHELMTQLEDLISKWDK